MRKMKQTGKTYGIAPLRAFLSVLLVLTMVFSAAMPNGLGAWKAYAAAGELPDHAKILQQNPDGTYTIALNVKGDADKVPQKVNVLVIVDRSGSMTRDSGQELITYTPNNNNGNNRYGTLKSDPDIHNDDDFFPLTRYNSGGVNVYTYPSPGSVAYTPGTNNNHNYGLVNGEYVQLTYTDNWGRRTWYANGQVYTGTRYRRRTDVAAYDGQRYIRSANQSRMAATQEAVNALAESLFRHNDEENPDVVEMALVSFATTASTDLDPEVTNDYETFANAVNELNAVGGTNWEDALQEAYDIDFDDSDPTFVIFFSDGAPTFHITDGGYGDWNSGYGVYGTGQDGAGNVTNMDRSYAQATDDAKKLADKVGAKYFYTIFAFGDTYGVGYMQDLTEAAGAPEDNYYSAEDSTELQAAFDEILEKIEMSGVGNVDINDGTTSKVTTSSGTAHLLDVADPSTFKYYRAGGLNEDGTEKYDSDANTITPRGGDPVNIGEEWTGTDVPKATFVDGEVQWDLGDMILEDDVTYTMTFDCWPSQETLDHIASIKNDPNYYNSLDPAIKAYLDPSGDLKTNTSASFSYEDTRTPETEKDEDHSYTNPPPVPTSAVEELAVAKKWVNELGDEWDDRPESIDLEVLRDGQHTYDVILGEDNDWEDGVFISIGIMRTSGEGESETVELLTTGHDFTFDEPDNLSYHWELSVPVVRPMKINGVDTILIKVDADHQPGDAKVYTLPDKDGIPGGQYYVSDLETVGLTAINERRSSLVLVKKVEGVDAPEDAIFPFSVTINNSLAPDTAPSETEDPGHDSDWWVWFSVWDENEQAVTEGVEGAIHAGPTSSWYYTASGSTFTIPVGDGYSIRFNNLPTGSTYTITEGTLPTGFIFEKAEIVVTEGVGTIGEDTFTGGVTSTGTIEETNTLYQVTYTNKYELIDINVDKVWIDNNNQDGIRPDSLTLTLNGLPAGTTAPEPEITKSEDGNTWTYVWKAVPRYDASGNEITYTVTENNVPDGYTCSGSPASDGGTITNTHTPEVIDIDVTKVWDDNNDQDGIRPDSVTVQLKKGEGDSATNVGAAVTLDGSTNPAWSYTWTGLPKMEDGNEIVYSVVESPVPEGYTVSVEGSASDGFTVTNKHEPEETQVTVNKVWKDDDNSAGTRPTSVSVTLYANGTAVGDAVTLSASTTPAWSYTWTELAVNEGGEPITYTLTEEPVENYATDISAISGTAETGFSFTVTNSNIPVDASTEAFFKKTVTAGNPTSSATFGFTISAAEGTPMPGSTTGTAEYAKGETGSKPIDFGKIIYTAAGTYTYTIEETSIPDGWTASGSPATVTVTVTGSAAEGFTASVTGGQITNTYAAEGKVSLEVTKELTGRDLAAEEFSFELKDADGKVLQTKKNALDGSVTFDDINYTAAGTYTYTITEVKGELGGVTYDEHTVTVTVEVVDNGDGTLTATPTYSPDKVFKNTYEASGSAPISATKKLTGKELKADMFSFELKDASGEVVETVKNAADGTITFTDLQFDQNDAGKTFEYTITEVNGGKRIDGISYDDLEIKVTVKVEDNKDGTLKVIVTYSSDTEFNNTYTVDETEIKLGVSKTLEVLSGNNAPDVKEKYTMVLTDANGNVIDEVKNPDGDGTAEYFDTITFTAPGTYIYKVYETGTVPAVTNDPAAATGDRTQDTGKTVTVTVTDQGDGTLTAEVTGGSQVTNFKNTYSAAPVSVDPPVQKVITGDLEDKLYNKGQFTFTIECTKKPENVETAPMPENTEISNKAEYELEGRKAFYEFGVITFTVPGEYEYTVTETGGADGITNDQQASKKITFTVTDNGEGQLVVTPTTDEAVFLFTNKYEAEPIEKAIEVDKSLVGKKLTEDDVFTFTLTPAEGSPGEVQTATNDATGHVKFDEITYDTAGVYTYTVTEVKEDDENISVWDEHTVTATVTVTDNWDGTFSVDVTYSPDSVFKNEYTPDPTQAVISVNKKLTGRGLNAGEFTFKLTEILPDDAPEGTEPLVLTAANDADGLVNFAAIEYEAAGTYTYEITEDVGDLGGVTYDTSTITATVVVTYDEMAGEFSTEVTYDPEEKTFINTYVPAPTKAKPVTEKILEGRALNEGEFSFQLIDSEGNVIQTVTNGADGSVVFADITFGTAGEYKYTIVEVEGDLGGVTYDRGTVEVTVNVTDNLEGNLVAEVTYGEKKSFKNTYKPAPTTAVIEASKELTGRALAEGEFSFSLVDEEGELVETVKNAADGDIVFSEISYDKTGTYTYTISETIGDAGGVTYDPDTVSVTVTVTDDLKGHLVAEVSYDPEEAKFINTYAANGSFTPEVTKVLTGRALKAGEFTFTMTDENGKVVDTQLNAADGKVTFKALDYTEADAGKTFTYKITEAKGSDPNITYDTHIATLTVTVEDNGDGTLKVEGTYSGGQTFTNKYTPPEEPKTGDTSRPEMWLGISGASLAGIIAMLAGRRRKVRK